MAINLKKKAGRPVKEKVTLKDVVTMKSNLEIKLEQAYANLEVKDVIIADLEKRLDDAFKEQEDMLKELDKSIYSTIHHCSQVECSTGKLTLHDVDYCIDLIKRIMKHKFEYKPQNFES
jgi:hypothetical protein